MKQWRIPVFDLTAEINEMWAELTAAIHGVLRSGQFIMGENVLAFESEVAQYLGVRYAVGVNSGTDALTIALKSIGVGPGDEVITSPFSFFATAESISLVGATPVFVDIDPETLNIDPSRIKERITPRTRAIIPVHLFGQAADMDPILGLARTCNAFVVEDCAQSFGAKYQGIQTGSIGDVGCFSFFPSKNLGCYGDGGLLTTNNPDIAQQAQMLRAHGSKQKYHNELVGFNSRLDEIQAAILRIKLKTIDDSNDVRQQIAHRYDELFLSLPGIQIPQIKQGSTHVYHQYTIRILHKPRSLIQAALADRGIASMVYYPIPIHKLPVYTHLNLHAQEAEKAAGEVLSLPMGRHITEAMQEEIVECIAAALD